MKPQTKPVNQIASPSRFARPAQGVPAIHPHAANRPTGPAHLNRLASPNVGAPARQGEAARPVSSPASKKTNYIVQAPIHLGGRSQQIRASIQGSPQVAGSVELSRGGAGKVYISNLKVDQQHRRRGVAAKLIDAAINTARRQGFRAASLEARPSDNGITSQALVAMYRRQGFKSVGKSQRGSPLMERKL